MNIKQLTLTIIITLATLQTVHCTNVETLNLITAQSEEISQAIKPETIKLLAAKAIETGLANIPLANLELLLAHEAIAAKIVSRMNYINDITKENVHLFIKPIADNFDHINQHTLDWIFYLKPDDIELTAPIIAKNLKATFDNNRQLLLNVLEKYPQYTKLFVQPVIDNFLFFANNYHGRIIIDKIMELNPGSIGLFIQPIIDNFLALANDKEGNHVIQHMIWLSPEAAKLFTQLVINNFSLLCDNLYGTDLIAEIIECYPDTTELFMQLIIDNFASLINSGSGLEIIAETMELYPAYAEQLKQPIIANSLLLLDNEHGRKMVLKILELYPDIEENHLKAIKTEAELILLSHILKLTKTAEWNAQYKVYTTILEYIKKYPSQVFMPCIINNFASLANNHLGKLILLKILKLYPQTVPQLAHAAIDNFILLTNNYYGYDTIVEIMNLYPDIRKQFIQTAIDNISTLANNYYGEQLLTKLAQHDQQLQKALDDYHFKSKVKDGLLIAGELAVGASLMYALAKYYIIPTAKAVRLARLKYMVSKIIWPEIPGLKPLNILWALYNKKQ